MASLFETGYGNSVVEHLYFCFAEIKKNETYYQVLTTVLESQGS